jgi:hypothetical protein
VGPWYHPSAQEMQPFFGEHKLAEDGRGWVKTHCCLADSWHGGSSLLLRGVIPPEVGNVAVRWVSDRARCVGLQLLLSFVSITKLGRGAAEARMRSENRTPIAFYKIMVEVQYGTTSVLPKCPHSSVSCAVWCTSSLGLSRPTVKNVLLSWAPIRRQKSGGLWFKASLGK